MGLLESFNLFYCLFQRMIDHCWDVIRFSTDITTKILLEYLGTVNTFGGNKCGLYEEKAGDFLPFYKMLILNNSYFLFLNLTR